MHRYVTELTVCSQRGISVKDKGLSMGSPHTRAGNCQTSNKQVFCVYGIADLCLKKGASSC